MKNRMIQKKAVLTGILFLLVVLALPAVAQVDLGQVESGLNTAKGQIKNIVEVIIGIIFLAGVIHVVIAFANGQQNAKDVGMKYFAGIVIFSVVWLIV